MKYKINKIINRVYNIEFEKHYDLSMLFVRYQEFYESPNPKFRGKAFELLDFMEWYSADKGNGCFAYPVQWAGFNIPSKVIDKVRSLGLTDENKYDREMFKLHDRLKSECLGDYYLIGGSGDERTLSHELAHGMYYTIPSYKREMNCLLDNLDEELYKKICAWLEKIGYTSQVFADETQAYLSTGFGKVNFAWKKAAKPFEKLYEEYRYEATHNSFTP